MKRILQPAHRAAAAAALLVALCAAELPAQPLSLGIGVTGAVATVTVSGNPGQLYSVESSTNLIVWTDDGGGRIPAGGATQHLFAVTAPFQAFRALDGGFSLSGVFSVNIVAYHVLTVPPGGDFMANHLIQVAPTAAALLPDGPNGLSVFKATESGWVANNFLGGWADPAMLLRPGEGFFVRNPMPSAVALTTFGEIPQGTLTINLPAGTALAASMVAQAGGLQNPLGYPDDNDGDYVLIYKPPTANFDLYDHFQGGVWSPSEPEMNVGQSCWITRPAPGSWVRNFSINFAGGGGGGNFVPANSSITLPAFPEISMGQLNFFTYNATNAALGRVLELDGMTPASSGLSAQLYAGTSAVEANLASIGGVVAFETGTNAGYCRPSNSVVNVPATSPGQTVHYQLRVWETARGATYEAAVATGAGQRGKSGITSAASGGSVLPPPNANLFPTFSLTTPPTNLITAGSIWRYRDDGSNQGTNWVSPGFNDGAWASGPAELGYGDGDEATVVNGGPVGNRYITTYFRHAFSVESPGAYTNLTATLLYDDGAIVYLNGIELFRVNMPAGTVTASNLALNANDNALVSTNLHPGLLRQGANVLAVEIHQANPTSSDISFNLALAGSVGEAVLSITNASEPVDRVVLEGRSTTLAIQLVAVPVPRIQWFKDGVPVAGATNATLLIPVMTAANAGNYFATASNAVGSVTSRTAMVTYQADGTAPAVVTAYGHATLSNILVSFSEPVRSTGPGNGAQDPANYTVALAAGGGARAVLSAVLTNGTNVLLTTEPRIPGSWYTLTVTGIRDTASTNGGLGNLLSPDPTSLTLPVQIILQEGLRGYAGTADTDLVSQAPGDDRGGLSYFVSAISFGEGQGLLRFENLLYNAGTGVVPPGSAVHSATLKLATAPSSDLRQFYLHRMLVPWSESSTYNGFTSGISTNDVEAAMLPEAVFSNAPVGGVVAIDVTASLHFWVAGQSNYGWTVLFSPLVSAGISRFESSESAATSLRPSLSVSFTPTNTPPSSMLNVFSTDSLGSVLIDISPVDRLGLGNGSTPLSRLYSNTTLVSLTAPATTPGNVFVKWQLDGIDHDTNLTTLVAVDAFHNLTAFYSQSPVIAAQPQSQGVSVGSNVTFSVTATGTAPLNYQWFFNAGVLAGATNTTLILFNVLPAQAGSYSVVVGNSVGSVTSTVVALNVQLWLCGGGPGPATGGGVDRFYEDGYVRVDASGNAGGLTTFWGYVNPTQVPGDGFIYFHCHGVSNSTLVTLTDRYPLNGVVPPAPPYDGTFSGPGPLISDSPVRTVTLNPCSPPPPGLIAWWPGDGDANDLVGPTHGTLQNGATFAPGKVGEAFSFDGVDDYVAVSDHPGLRFAGEFTVFAWVRPNRFGPPGYLQPIIHKDPQADGDRSFYFGLLPAGTLQLGVFGTGSGTVASRDSDASLATGEWHHVAGVYRGGASPALNVYINGQLHNGSLPGAGVIPPSIHTNAHPVFIGAYVTGIHPFPSTLDGLLDEVALFDRALSPGEIAALYAAGGAGMCRPGFDGTPIILVNGQYFPVAVAVTNGASLAITSSLGGPIFYTLDGSDPAGGSLYAGPFSVSNSVTVRAIAYSGDFALEAEADAVVVTVLRAPSIIAQPVGALAAVGGSVSFAVGASGSAPLSYQWRKDGLVLPGATASSLVLSNVMPADAGLYSVLVSNSVGTATSADAALAVAAPPMIAGQPAGTNVLLGGTAIFCVSPSGTGPFLYQWRLNGVNIPDATNQCLVILNVSLEDGGSYAVVVQNAVDAITSDAALLRLDAPSPPSRDNFANGLVLEESSGTVRGTNNFATKEPGEPNHGGKAGGASVWHRWTAPSNGVATVRTVGSTFDTLLGVYTGASVAALTLIAQDEDSGGFHTSLVRFNVSAGVTYHVAVDGLGGAEGEFLLDWSLEPTVQTIPVITAAPTNQTVAAGGTAQFSVTATGDPLTYQWFFNGVLQSGQTNTTLTISNVQPADVGFYVVRVRNSAGRQVQSLPAALELGPDPAVQSTDKFADLFAGGTNGPGFAPATTTPSFSGGFSLAAGVVYDPHRYNNSLSSAESDEPNHCGVQGGASDWFRITNNQAGLLVIDTAGSSVDTVLALYARVFVLRELFTNVVTCNDDAAAGQRHSRIEYPVAAGAIHALAIDGKAGDKGDIRVRLGLGSPPVVTAATPALQLARRGGAATFAVHATGTPMPRYQWCRDTLPLTGETNALLLLTDTQPADSGRYDVLVDNFIGASMHHAGDLLVADTLTSLEQTTFDTGADDWQADGDYTNLVHRTSDGNPGGHLQLSDRQVGGIIYWNAPARYLGHQLAAWGGWIEYDLKQSTTASPHEAPDVILNGGAGLELSFDTPRAPGTDWTSYKIPLSEGRGWKKGALDGPAATAGELQAVLTSLTGLRIRAEYSQSQETNGLDNFALVAPCTNDLVRLEARLVAPGMVRLEWPISAVCHEVEASMSCTAEPGAWQSLAADPRYTVVPQGALNTVLIPTEAPHQFFRLRKQ